MITEKARLVLRKYERVRFSSLETALSARRFAPREFQRTGGAKAVETCIPLYHNH